jgi:transposase
MLFAIEREISGASPERRLAVRNERSRPIVTALEVWLREQRGRLSGKSETARAVEYSRKRWPALTRFLDDGRLCLSNNAAERALRGIPVGRHNWTFAGSDEGARRAAALCTPVETAKLNESIRRPGSLRTGAIAGPSGQTDR